MTIRKRVLAFQRGTTRMNRATEKQQKKVCWELEKIQYPYDKEVMKFIEEDMDFGGASSVIGLFVDGHTEAAVKQFEYLLNFK